MADYAKFNNKDVKHEHHSESLIFVTIPENIDFTYMILQNRRIEFRQITEILYIFLTVHYN